MPDTNDSGGKPGAAESSETLAADEPTAMWDEASLREAGFNQVAAMETREARTNPVVPEAPTVGPSIVIDHMPDAATAARNPGTPVRPSPIIVPAKKRPTQGLSWPLTIGLAAALGTFVYLIVRFLK
ncbi:MAG: hypothetical protein IT379_08825 [Deltaproteobacteria bacterium]|nr:hypothetical protein [Deltaproteobacteria bacterium]